MISFFSDEAYFIKLKGKLVQMENQGVALVGLDHFFVTRIRLNRNTLSFGG
jgi:hypothetical protein